MRKLFLHGVLWKIWQSFANHNWVSKIISYDWYYLFEWEVGLALTTYKWWKVRMMLLINDMHNRKLLCKLNGRCHFFNCDSKLEFLKDMF